MNCKGQVNGRAVEISDFEDDLTFSFDDENDFYYSISGGYRALRDYWENEYGIPVKHEDGGVEYFFDEQAVIDAVKRNAPEYIEKNIYTAERIKA